jgi:hypothetical protein
MSIPTIPLCTSPSSLAFLLVVILIGVFKIDIVGIAMYFKKETYCGVYTFMSPLEVEYEI